VTLRFDQDAINDLADLTVNVNTTVENIGARRLHTIMEKLLDDISFTASDNDGHELIISREYVEKHVGELAKDSDLSKFIL
jgi:ATP-dependent HslUV protease ATP-binding subunit HslU